MRRKLILASLLVCSFFVGSVWAFPQVFPAPALNGPTGLTRIPDANVIPYKNFNIGASYGKALGGSEEATMFYNMNLGTFHGVEVGIVGGTPKGSSDFREGVFVNMKLSLSTGDEPYPLLLAMGVENLFSKSQTDVYMVASKYFKQGPKLTFGFMADFPESHFRPLGITGVELPMAETLILNADLMAGETLFQVNGGARFYFSPIFCVNLSGLNLTDNPQAKDSRSALIG